MGVHDAKMVFTMRDESDSRETVQSVIRACSILEAFSVERPVLNVSEIASIVGINRTTVHRLLTTLESRGYVQRAPDSQKFTIGTQIARLANVFFSYSDVRSVGYSTIVSLRDATNHTSALHIRQHHNRVVIAQAESWQDLRVTYPDVGTPIPLHIGAPGKAILAHLSSDELEHYLETETLTLPRTNEILNVDQLRRELELTKGRGYSVTSQERRVGVVSVAAPIFSATGAAIASVNFSAPIQRITESEVEAFAGLVVQAGNAISAQLGHFR
jgi:IclR family acetate operon transcriptional repressor